MKKYAIRVRKLLTNGREHGIIIFVLARLAQLVEHMLDVHGVTGSSPVPRTREKALKLSSFKAFCCPEASFTLYRTLYKLRTFVMKPSMRCALTERISSVK